MSPEEEFFVPNFQNTQVVSVISIYRADICWVKKRLQIIFCVFYHLNTDY